MPSHTRAVKLLPLAIGQTSVVNCLGRSTGQVLQALRNGVSGLGTPSFRLPFPTVVGEVRNAMVSGGPFADRPEYQNRTASIGWLAANELTPAVEDLKTRFKADRIGLFIGTSTGGLDATEAAFERSTQTPNTWQGNFALRQQHDFHAFTEFLKLTWGITGPSLVVSTACSSSGKTFGAAQRWISAGVIDAAIVGGVDCLCRMTLDGFKGLGILDETPCRPFSKERRGINIGEGSAFATVERVTPSASPIAYLVGVGESADAYNMSSPEPEGRGAEEAMRRALAMVGDAAKDPDAPSARVGYVNAHGTATQQNDAAEAKAIERVLGQTPWVSSTKGYTGHLLGAAAATEAVFTIEVLRTKTAFGSLGTDPVDPDLHIKVATQHTPFEHGLALSNSFAFGGSNVCLAFASPEWFEAHMLHRQRKERAV